MRQYRQEGKKARAKEKQKGRGIERKKDRQTEKKESRERSYQILLTVFCTTETVNKMARLWL